MKWPPVQCPERDIELDALCRSPWGDTPWGEIPQNWRDVEPPHQYRRRRGERGPDKDRPRGIWSKDLAERAAEMKARMLGARRKHSKGDQLKNTFPEGNV